MFLKFTFNAKRAVCFSSKQCLGTQQISEDTYCIESAAVYCHVRYYHKISGNPSVFKNLIINDISVTNDCKR